MFFKKKDQNSNNDLIKVAALLIHAAKIDQNFSKKRGGNDLPRSFKVRRK